jgi:hypothetical protein
MLLVSTITDRESGIEPPRGRQELESPGRNNPGGTLDCQSGAVLGCSKAARGSGTSLDESTRA